jgi:hypothetical protein
MDAKARCVGAHPVTVVYRLESASQRDLVLEGGAVAA